MPSIFRRWAVVLLVAVLPAQAALAAGGLWCERGAMADPAMSATHHPEDAFGHAAAHDGHDSGQHEDGDTSSSRDAHGACAGCAPCCGSLAPPAAPSAGADLAQDHGADFLPILVLIRPARPDQFERPPRAI